MLDSLLWNEDELLLELVKVRLLDELGDELDEDELELTLTLEPLLLLELELDDDDDDELLDWMAALDELGELLLLDEDFDRPLDDELRLLLDELELVLRRTLAPPTAETRTTDES